MVTIIRITHEHVGNRSYTNVQSVTKWEPIWQTTLRFTTHPTWNANCVRKSFTWKLISILTIAAFTWGRTPFNVLNARNGFPRNSILKITWFPIVIWNRLSVQNVEPISSGEGLYSDTWRCTKETRIMGDESARLVIEWWTTGINISDCIRGRKRHSRVKSVQRCMSRMQSYRITWLSIMLGTRKRVVVPSARRYLLHRGLCNITCGRCTQRKGHSHVRFARRSLNIDQS